MKKVLYLFAFFCVIVRSLNGLTRSEPVFGTVHRGVGGQDSRGILRRFAGLPPDLRIISMKKAGSCYLLLSRSHGAFFHKMGDSRWWPLQNGLPAGDGGLLPFEDIDIFPSTGDFAAVSAHRIWLYRRQSRKWVQLNPPVYSPFNTFTAIAVSEIPSRSIAVATSYNGVQIGRWDDGGVIRWRRRAAGLPGWGSYGTVITYETVAGLVYVSSNRLAAVPAYSDRIYYLKPDATRWQAGHLRIPAKIGRISRVRRSGDLLLLHGEGGIYRAAEAGRITVVPAASLLRPLRADMRVDWVGIPEQGIDLQYQMPRNSLSRPDPFPVARRQRLRKAAGKRALYVRADLAADRAYLEKLVVQMKQARLNAVVVDMKDDNGILTYDSTNRTALQIGAVRKRFSLKALVQFLRKHDIYLIARVVVFKDGVLFKYAAHKYAIRDKITGKPWIGGASHPEHWVDPHADFVQAYNGSIAVELAARGVDEIQFDYIRFPTDGAVFRCRYPYLQQNEFLDKAGVLQKFLKRCRRLIGIPLSVDIYGFSGWYRMGDRMGQDIQRLAPWVDVISPMYYPSHFGPKFLNRDPFLILKMGTARAASLAGSGVLIRPWLQAFWEAHGPYIVNQVDGVSSGGGSGYCFWNINGKYRRVFVPLKQKMKYIK